jgi:CRP-like cAMP-binding protein
MDTTAQLQKIKAYYFKLLPQLTDTQWELCAASIIIRQYKKGELLLRPGQVCDRVSFINYGIGRFYYLVDGKEFIGAFFDEECAYFSDYESFLTRQPSRRYIEALEDMEVADISYNMLQELYQKIPAADRLGRIVAEGLYIQLSKRNASLLIDSPEQRYQTLLAERPALIQRVPQYMIASYLGITPEALSRIRSRLSKRTATVLIDLDQ